MPTLDGVLRRPALILLIGGIVSLLVAWAWNGTVFDDPPSSANGWVLNVDVFGVIGIAAIGGAIGWTVAGLAATARARRRGRR